MKKLPPRVLIRVAVPGKERGRPDYRTIAGYQVSPNFVAHEPLPEDAYFGPWVLTHQRSGMSAGNLIVSVERATEYAMALEEVLDWSTVEGNGDPQIVAHRTELGLLRQSYRSQVAEESE